MGICSFSAYCINTSLPSFTGYNGNYTAIGVYNSYLYYTGGTSSTYYIYFNTGNTVWCVSSSLGGSCTLFGSNFCYGDCPDLDSSFYSTGVCPTPTQSVTPHCDIDFTVIFNCEITSSPTPTQTPTPTLTPTITPSVFCPVNADVIIQYVSPTPSNSPSPSVSLSSTGVCSNSVSEYFFEVLDNTIICNQQNIFRDCVSNATYYTSSPASFNGSVISVNSIYRADVNGVSTCVTYIGTTINAGNNVNVVLTLGSYTNCTDCIPNIIVSQTRTPQPTPTPTGTSSVTPTPTPTRNISGITNKYIYSTCDESLYIVQDVQLSINGAPLTISEQSFVYQSTCYKYVDTYYGSVSNIPISIIPQGSNVITNSTNYFSNTIALGSSVYPNCNSCLNPTSTDRTWYVYKDCNGNTYRAQTEQVSVGGRVVPTGWTFDFQTISPPAEYCYTYLGSYFGSANSSPLVPSGFPISSYVGEYFSDAGRIGSNLGRSCADCSQVIIPNSNWYVFQDCNSSFYVVQSVPASINNTNPNVGQAFSFRRNSPAGEFCVTYRGFYFGQSSDPSQYVPSGANVITNLVGDYFSDGGSSSNLSLNCERCLQGIVQVTPTPTPTKTKPAEIRTTYYVYIACRSPLDNGPYILQTSPILINGNRIQPNTVFQGSTRANPSSNSCYIYVGSYLGYFSQPISSLVPPGATTINGGFNYFNDDTANPFLGPFSDCGNCNNTL